MDLNEIQSLIKFVAKSGVDKVELETKEIKITISKGDKNEISKATYIAPTPQVVPVTQSMPLEIEKNKDSTTKKDKNKYITIKSPMIGTFYLASAPNKPHFKKIGDTISEGDVICIVEAMKLFNEIEAEVKGKIVKILVDDATPVEYDQPLFLIEP